VRSERVIKSGMDIGVGRVLSRLPRKSCWGSGWLKTYLRRLTVIMIEELGTVVRAVFESCDCCLCRRRDRIRETRAQTRADMTVFLVIAFPDVVDASTFDKLSSLLASKVKRLEVTGGNTISVEGGTDPAVETAPAPAPGIEEGGFVMRLAEFGPDAGLSFDVRAFFS